MSVEKVIQRPTLAYLNVHNHVVLCKGLELRQTLNPSYQACLVGFRELRAFAVSGIQAIEGMWKSISAKKDDTQLHE